MGRLESYFRVLIAVARSDGDVDVSEAELIRAAMDGIEVSGRLREDLERLLDASEPCEPTELLKTVANQADPSSLAEALRDAYVIAAADGRLDKNEISVIDRLLSQVGIDAERRPLFHEWARTAAEHHMEGLAMLAEVLGAH